MIDNTLLLRIKDAKYKILVACRPLAPARYAFNATLQAIIDSDICDSDEIEALKAMMLLE